MHINKLKLCRQDRDSGDRDQSRASVLCKKLRLCRVDIATDGRVWNRNSSNRKVMQKIVARAKVERVFCSHRLQMRARYFVLHLSPSLYSVSGSMDALHLNLGQFLFFLKWYAKRGVF